MFTFIFLNPGTFSSVHLELNIVEDVNPRFQLLKQKINTKLCSWLRTAVVNTTNKHPEMVKLSLH